MSGSKQILNPAFIKSSKAIIQNLKNVSEVDKQLFERALAIIDKEPITALRIIQTNQQCQALLDDHMLEFNTWKESFNHVVKELNKSEELDKLISLQPKIKAKVPHNSYSSLLIAVVKKDLKFDEQFLSKWRQQKKKMKQERSKKFQLQKLKKKQIKEKEKQTQKTPPKQQKKLQIKPKQQIKVKQPPAKNQPSVPSDQKQKRQKLLKQKQSIEQQKKVKQEKQQQKQPQQQKIKQDNKLQQSKQNQIQLKLKKQKDLERQRKLQQKYESIMKLKNYNEMRFKKNKQFRLNSLIKYLQSRKQFNFNTTKEVAKEIILNVDKFMKYKVEEMLRVSKMRLPGYVNEQAGDLFRMYSNKSTQIQLKNAILLPQNDIKILKLQYPSKAQQYLKLRVQQEYQQEKLQKQFNQRLQSSKKTNKIIQTYTLPQQKQNIHQFKVDPGPKKRERLIVSQQSIQYIIQDDPWFCDTFAMQRAFYHLPYETDN